MSFHLSFHVFFCREMIYKLYPHLTSVSSGLSNCFFPAKTEVLALLALDTLVCPVGKETVSQNFLTASFSF